MVVGPFARIIAQVGMVAGGAIGRAVVNAYRQAASQAAANPQARSVLFRKMHLEEARQVLDVTAAATPEEIAARAARLIEINSKSGSSMGSPYLVKKITNAELVLCEAAEAQANAAKAKAGQEGAKKATTAEAEEAVKEAAKKKADEL